MILLLYYSVCHAVVWLKHSTNPQIFFRDIPPFLPWYSSFSSFNTFLLIFHNGVKLLFKRRNNSCTRVYKNWSKMKFVIFSKIHVPGSMKIGKKWSLIFFWKFIYPGLGKMTKIEVCFYFENSRTRVYKNWPKINFDIFLEIHVPGSTKIG